MPKAKLLKLQVLGNLRSSQKIIPLTIMPLFSSARRRHHHSCGIIISFPSLSPHLNVGRLDDVLHMFRNTLPPTVRPFLIQFFPPLLSSAKKVFRSKVMSLASRHPLHYVLLRSLCITNQPPKYTVRHQVVSQVP